MSEHDEVVIFVRLALRLKRAPSFLDQQEGETWLEKYLRICEINNSQLRKARLFSNLRVNYRLVYFVHDDLKKSMRQMIKTRLTSDCSEVVEIDGNFNKSIIDFLKGYSQNIWQVRLDADDLISYSAIQELSHIEHADLVFFNRGLSALFPGFEQILAIQEIWKGNPPFLALKENSRSVYEFQHDKWPLDEFKTRVLDSSPYWVQFVHGSNRSNEFGSGGWLVYRSFPRESSILKKYFEFVELPINRFYFNIYFLKHLLFAAISRMTKNMRLG